MQKNKSKITYRAAIYTRLSEEDKIVSLESKSKQESNSISKTTYLPTY